MRHNFSISFYLKHSTPRKSGKYPIMLRITINKEVADVSLKTLILPEYWDKQRKQALKTAPDAHAINTYLDEVYTTLHYYYKQELLSSAYFCQPVKTTLSLDRCHPSISFGTFHEAGRRCPQIAVGK